MQLWVICPLDACHTVTRRRIYKCFESFTNFRLLTLWAYCTLVSAKKKIIQLSLDINK